MVAFESDAMPDNASLQNELPSCIEAENTELWFGVRFCIMDDAIYPELRIISITTGKSVKCYCPKLFPSFKATLELSFNRIMHVNKS